MNSACFVILYLFILWYHIVTTKELQERNKRLQEENFKLINEKIQAQLEKSKIREENFKKIRRNNYGLNKSF